MDENKTQTLIVEQQKRLSMTGVLSVDAFTPQCVQATLANGKMTITGENLKVSSFSKTSANLAVDGSIFQIKFADKKLPFLKRLTR